ncbi:MAG: acetyl-CoA carboxylase biotin carboxyl carrier protein [Oscillospiraceae bacterium]|nr:acetyl-CoA carboxylase biotin carboxyl carrier protein [Oscillospiraceae bacterium]
MYSIEEIKELIATLGNSGLTNLEIVDQKGERLTLKKKTTEADSHAVNVTVPVGTVGSVAPTAAIPQVTESQAAPDEPQAQPKGKTIDCPMVGVFYTAPSPEADPYVKVGSVVNKGDVVCIIEAMKLMNEVTATQSGTIKEILAENGDIVEYGQPLFVVE